MLHPNSASPYTFPFKLPGRKLTGIAIGVFGLVAVFVILVLLIPAPTPAQIAQAKTIEAQLVAKPPLGSLLVWQSGGVAPLIHNCNGCIATYRTLFGDRVPIIDRVALVGIARVVHPNDPDYPALAAKYLGGL